MKSTKAIVLSICAVLLVAMAGAGMAMASEESNVDMDVGDTSNAPEGSASRGTYTFEIGPGGSWSTTSVLGDYAPADYDVYVMTVLDGCTVTVKVVDCCMMGDTMGLKAGKKIHKATSPATIEVSATLKPGTYKFYVGYLTPHTGVFPAGYSTYVSAV